MIDKLLEVGGTFDWITPVCTLIFCLLGEHTGFALPKEHLAWAEIELKAKGIRIYFPNLVGDNATFTVNARQAKFARYLLGIK